MLSLFFFGEIGGVDMENIYVTENTEYKGKYFYIVKQKYRNRKTDVYHIFDYNTNFLGDIKWFPKWRTYCFFPYQDTVWDYKCLCEIQNQLEGINFSYKVRGDDIEKS